MEAELVDEEADAAIVIAHEDVDALDAEVRMLRRGGGGAGGHGEIIRGGGVFASGDEVGDNLS